MTKTKLPDYLSTFEGALWDNRTTSPEPLRKNYSLHHREIESLADVKATLRAGPYTFLGCYPLYFITSDGAALCFGCAEKEFRQVVWDYLGDCSTGWRIVGCDINYEDTSLFCDHCSKKIESAYGEG